MSESSIFRTKEQLTEHAKSLALVCIFPEPNELFLDIDKPFVRSNSEKHEHLMRVLDSNGVEVVSTLRTKSKSGNMHVYLRLNPEINLSVAERVALQAAFGSDSVREVLSIIRIFEGVGAPSVLFETPEEAKNVEHWRQT